MKVEIDRGTCVSCGSYRGTCPDLSEQDPDDSFSRIVGKYRREGNIAKETPPESMEPCAREAADLCPVQIIRIEES
jgi:ferredoxin